MKKYVKPELYFESFELSQQIAACDYDSNNTFDDNSQNDPNSPCRFSGTGDFGEMTIFLSNCGRDESTVDVSDYGYCYHNSTSYPLGIFNS